MNDALVLREDQGSVTRLTLNNPAKLNALSNAMLAALHMSLDDVAEDASIRVVILNGAGKVFCAGHDLKEMQAARETEDGGKDTGSMKNIWRTIDFIENMPGNKSTGGISGDFGDFLDTTFRSEEGCTFVVIRC